MAPTAPPILDFSPIYGTDAAAKAKLVQQVRESCEHNGFFQITGDRILRELQVRVMNAAKRFFALPVEEKMAIDQNRNTFNRGYELLRSQMLEVGTAPELKEGLYIGEEIGTDHPYYINGRLNSGPNQWPATVPDTEEFRQTSMEYYHAVYELTKDVLAVLALTPDVEESFFDPLIEGGVATMRMLHYPSQPKDADEKLNRGIGAHTDFGCITLLLQDEVDGLQVLDAPSGQWLDVQPVAGAYVVNLGDLMMRMANDRYKSNIHRVINKSGRERYSIPFFFSGNPDYVCKCLPNCCKEGEWPKYPPITVEDMVKAAYKRSYGQAEAYKKELAEKAKAQKMEAASATEIISTGSPAKVIMEIELDKRGKPQMDDVPTEDIGKMEVVDDAEMEQFYGSSTTDAYRLKSELISRCMEDIGMGRFQWKLFAVAGFGWVVDNFCSQGISAVQPPIQQEFSGIKQVSYSSVAYYVGMILAASFWGISSDLIGRKPAFNSTLAIAGIFLCAAAGTTTSLEFAPGRHQFLLTALSGWWNFGQLVVSLLAWVFLANFSCPTNATPDTCSRADNMGWRYTLITLGGLSLAFTCIRIFVFKMPETPRYLLSQGKDQAAVDAVNYVARQNGKPEPLTLSMLQAIDARLGTVPNAEEGLTTKEILKENMKEFRGEHYRALFATPRLSQHTALIWAVWLIIGIAYPLYFNFLPSYLATRFTENSSLDLTYRNYSSNRPSGLVAAFRGGPRVFLFAYVGVKTRTSSLAFSCVTGLLRNFEYAVMYAFTPESFPAPHRGTATGTAASLWVGVGVLCFGLPFETHGHAAI
ncbi:hypothetical protein BDW66DRAFT_165087 [Aspergillus desertorum]